MRAVAFLALLGSFGALACGAKEEDQSQLTTLRVLGVRKDKPYAAPGDTVKVSILYDDGAPFDTDAAPKKRDIQVGWLAGCENPLGDVYALCFPDLAKAVDGGLNLSLGGGIPGDGGSPDAPHKGERLKLGAGPEFSFTLSTDIISRRPRPVDRSPPYGLAYVFFFVCGGTLGPAPAGQDFPIACFSKSGTELGANDFVAGYTAVYAYDGITNKNPIVKGFTIDGSTVTPECIDEACVVEEGAPATPPAPSDAGADAAGLDAGSEGGVRDAGTRESGVPAADSGKDSATPNPCTDPKAPACIAVCHEANQDDCPEHDIKLVTDTAVEEDTVAERRDNRPLKEQSWINYYVDQGELTHDVKLLGDATNGYNEDHGTQLRAPKKVGPFHVWAVAHDSRGGTSWLKVELATRPK